MMRGLSSRIYGGVYMFEKKVTQVGIPLVYQDFYIGGYSWCEW